MAALVINIDEFKKKIPDYDPCRAEEFHTQSAKMADLAYEKAIKDGKYKKIIFLCGGSASGKTEFVESYLKTQEAIIFDSTFSSNEGAKNKLRPAIKKKMEILIYFIQPRSLLDAYIAFKNRERKFDSKYFTKTHIGSRETFLFLVDKYSKLVPNEPAANIKFVYLMSFVSHLDLSIEFQQIDVNPQDLISILKQEQLTEGEINDMVKINSLEP